jgi:hypothetical protein
VLCQRHAHALTCVVLYTGNVDPKFMCTKHTDQKLVVYCRDCSTLACAVCGLTSHSKHTCIETDLADEEFRQAIGEKINESQKAIANHNKNIAEYRELLRQEQVSLDARCRQLETNRALLNDTHASYVERAAAVLSLPAMSRRVNEPRRRRGSRWDKHPSQGFDNL